MQLVVFLLSVKDENHEKNYFALLGNGRQC